MPGPTLFEFCRLMVFMLLLTAWLWVPLGCVLWQLNFARDFEQFSLRFLFIALTAESCAIALSVNVYRMMFP
jgi:hypothetical protein